MKYYSIEAEVAGGLGPRTKLDRSAHPPIVTRLHYEFSGWLGDEIVDSFPAYVVTKSLATRIMEASLSGLAFADVEVTTSPEFCEMYPNRQLPEFLWLKPNGVAGADDFGIGRDHRLVVSANALAVLMANEPTAMTVEEYKE
jgi:hypothetical protein